MNKIITTHVTMEFVLPAGLLLETFLKLIWSHLSDYLWKRNLCGRDNFSSLVSLAINLSSGGAAAVVSWWLSLGRHKKAIYLIGNSTIVYCSLFSAAPHNNPFNVV